MFLPISNDKIVCHVLCDKIVSGYHSVRCFTHKCKIKREGVYVTFRCPNHRGEWLHNTESFSEAVDYFDQHMKEYHDYG